MRQWWVTQAGRQPIGPVAEDVVVRGIQAGKVPSDSLVCEVGGDRWKTLQEVTQFGTALTQVQADPEARASLEPATIAEMEPIFWDEPRDPDDARTETSLNPPSYPGDDAICESEETVVDRGSSAGSGRR